MGAPVPLSRWWNTWDADHPADLVYLPLGVKLAVRAYSHREARLAGFAAGTGVRLGPRSVDGRVIHLELEHAGTRIALKYTKLDPFTVHGEWETLATGEWGLRFWLLLCLEFWPRPAGVGPAGGPTSGAQRSLYGGASSWALDPFDGSVSTWTQDTRVVVQGERPPLLVTFHDSLDDLARELAEHGYFYPGSAGNVGRVAVLRYNLEEMPNFRFTARVEAKGTLARRPARDGAESGPAERTAPGERGAPALPSQRGRFPGALDAVRDVVAWNTVWDAINRRPYTALSRQWVGEKFGGFGVWMDDVFYHALMASAFDEQLARENLQAVLAGATPEGNIPCLLTGRDRWVDRSQPPIGAFITWLLYLRTGARSLLELAYEPLLRNYDWWYRARDGNGNGLLEYGNSPVGSGMYRGTKLGAKNESSMDNSPVHDEAQWQPDRGTLDCEDVGLNSLLALEGEMLGHMAEALGDDATAARVRERAAKTRELIRSQLWDAEREAFANRLWSGRFVKSLAPTSFYPLLCGAATPEQARAMVERHLKDPRGFGGRWVLPSVRRDDPAYADNVYWRGRVWGPLNFLVYHGLRRYGFDAEAAELAERSVGLFMQEWERHRHCHENYNAETGAGCDSPDSDPFYTWGALLPWLGVCEVMDITPWHGWEIQHTGEEIALGPVRTPAGMAHVAADGGWLRLAVDGRPVLATNVRGRLRGIRVTPALLQLEIPPAGDPPGGHAAPADVPARYVVVAHGPGARVVQAWLDHEPVTGEATPEGVRFQIPERSAYTRLTVYRAPAGGV
ncbi:MAG TPA: trehalase family glycosidase [Limnochordales bacterium]